MKRLKIAQYIALVATAMTLIGVYLGGITGSSTGSAVMGIALTVGMVSYIFGGLLTAGKMAGKIAKWGWFVVPFPYDIIKTIPKKTAKQAVLFSFIIYN